MSNFVALQQEVCNIFAVENLCSLKLCYTPMPHTVPNFIELGQAMYKKGVTNFLHNYFGTSGDPWVKVHWSWHWCTVARLRLSTCQISCSCDNLSTRFLLPNFDDIVKSVTETDRLTKGSTVNGMSPHTMRRQKNNKSQWRGHGIYGHSPKVQLWQRRLW